MAHDDPSRPDVPIVIAHRGASGYRPEHTLASYELAIRLGADYVEPDLVSTRDGALVCRHENEISGTTDVADHPEYADRRTTKVIDGREVEGWFTEDFTLGELRALRARERLPGVRRGNTRYDGRFGVPTFDELLTLVTQASRSLGREIGVYPETKHPTYFEELGLGLERPMLDSLERHGLGHAGAPVFLQSFETTNLSRLRTLTDLPLVLLVEPGGQPYDIVAAGGSTTYADLVAPLGLTQVAGYADAIGVHTSLVLTGDNATPTSLVRDAHLAGLDVHVWTLRDEQQFMARRFWRDDDPDHLGDTYAAAQAFFDAGVDGVFTDFTDSVLAARDAWRS